MIRLAIAGLLSVACGLMAMLAWELGVYSTTEPAIDPRPGTVAAAHPVVAADHSGDWVATILARPLFTPDRRPPSETKTATGAGMPQELPRLAGVVVGPFGRSAIFAVDGSKPVVATEGSHVGAWFVRSIAGGTVEVTGPGGTLTLHPSFQSSPAAPIDVPPTAQHVGFSLPR